MGSGRPFRAARLVGGQLDPQLAGQTGDDLVLHAEEVGQGFIEALGPEMTAGRGVDELCVDAHLVLIALHRTFQHVTNAQLLADLLGVDAFAFVSKGGVARDDEGAA